MAPHSSFIPAECARSLEFRQRVRNESVLWTTPLPVFERPRRAMVIVDVARAWGGKPMRITSAGPDACKFRLGEQTGSRARPIVCWSSTEAAAKAPRRLGVVNPSGTVRQLLILEVGLPGDGLRGIKQGRNGQLTCETAKPVQLVQFSHESDIARVAAQNRFWLPAGGVEPE